MSVIILKFESIFGEGYEECDVKKEDVYVFLFLF